MGFTFLGQFHFRYLVLAPQTKGSLTIMSFSKYGSCALLRKKTELLGSSTVQFIIHPCPAMAFMVLKSDSKNRLALQQI